MSGKSGKEPLSARLQRYKEAKAKKKQEELDKRLQSVSDGRRPLQSHNRSDRISNVHSAKKIDHTRQATYPSAGQSKRKATVKLDAPVKSEKSDDSSHRLSYTIDVDALISVDCKVTSGGQTSEPSHPDTSALFPVAASNTSNLKRKSLGRCTATNANKRVPSRPLSATTVPKKTASSFASRPVEGGKGVVASVTPSGLSYGTTCVMITRRERLAAWKANEQLFRKVPVRPTKRTAPVQSRVGSASVRPDAKSRRRYPPPRTSVCVTKTTATKNIAVASRHQQTIKVPAAEESKPKGRPRLLHVKARTDSNFQGARKSCVAPRASLTTAAQNPTTRKSYPNVRGRSLLAVNSPAAKRYSVPNGNRAQQKANPPVRQRHSLASRLSVKEPTLPPKRSMVTPTRRNSSGTNRTPVRTPLRRRTLLPPLVETSVLASAAKSPWARNTATPACTPLRKEPSRRERLISWMKSRGRTPSKFSHLLQDDTLSGNVDHLPAGLSVQQMKQQQAALGSEVDHFHKAHDVKKLKIVLIECLRLLETDCPVDICAEWLSHLEQMDSVQGIATFWVLKARLAEVTRVGDPISIYEQAVHCNATPPEEVATALQSFVQRMSDRQMKTPQRPLPSREVFASSAVKFCLSETSDVFNRVRSRSTSGIPTPTTPPAVMMVTPVRRSTRRSCVHLPAMLRDHDVVVTSLEQVPAHVLSSALHRDNHALTNDVC